MEVRKRASRKTHFSKSATDSFPNIVLHDRHTWNELKTQLVFDPEHTCGQPNKLVDLSRWSGFKMILARYVESRIPITGLVLCHRPECNDGVLIRFAESPFVTSLEELVLSGCFHLSRLSLQYISRFEFIRKLSLSKLSFVDDAYIHTIATNLFQLSTLDISHCSTLTDDALVSIADLSCLNLTHLNCSFLPHVTQRGLNDIVSKCSHLEYLDLQSCPKVAFVGIVVNVRDNMLQYIARHLKTLIVDNCSELQHYSLVWMSVALPDLEHFSAQGVRLMDDNVMKAMVGGARKLKTLQLTQCKRISHQTWDALDSYTPALTTLCLSQVHDSVDMTVLASVVVKLCATLRVLQINGLRSVDNSFSQVVSAAVQQKQSTFVLRSLDVSYTTLSTVGIVLLLRSFPLLTELRIDGLKDVADAALLALPVCCPHLHHLYASGCRSLTDTGVMALCQHAKELVTLHVAYELVDLKFLTGLQFSDAVLECILTRTKKLRDVNISHQLGITLASKATTKWFTRHDNYALEKLDLTGCKELHLTHLPYVFRHCHAICEVLLPETFISHASLGTKKFYDRAFAHSLYTSEFDAKDYTAAVERVRKSLEFTINTKKASFAPHEVKIQQMPLGLQILRPNANSELLRFKDAFYRRRLLELHAVRVIQICYDAHRVWMRFKTRIMKRRIVKVYRAYIGQKKHAKALFDFTRRHAAHKICRWYIEVHLQYLRAVKVIIRMFHRWKRQKLDAFYAKQTPKAILIQKRVRGMLVRLSSQHIMAQIYLQMPEFWKEVMRLAPSERKALKRLNVEGYQVTGLHKEAHSMLSHITEDIAKGQKLAPKLPGIIPQPFDKDPYVSLSDGHRLCFYSTSTSLFRPDYLQKTKNAQSNQLSADQVKYLEGKAQGYKKERTVIGVEMLQNHLPVHIYSARFWPPTQAPQLKDTSTELFDSTLSGFDVAQNSREVLWCDMCHNRLQMIRCQSCSRGYCFFCGFAFHRTLQKRSHSMQLMEPRIVHVHQAEKSLLFHVENATSAMHDLKYVVKYLRSATEVQRLAKERRLLKEYEDQQEQLRLAFLQAQELYKERNVSATRISLLYRCRKARQTVINRRLQVQLEAGLAQQNRFYQGLRRLQVLVRRFEARMWLFRRGFLFRGLSKYTTTKEGRKVLIKAKRTNNKGKVLSIQALLQRRSQQLLRRGFYTRSMLFGDLDDRFRESLQLLRANVRHWIQSYDALEPRILSCETLRTTLFNEYREQQRQNAMAELSGTENERRRLEKLAKRLQLRYENVEERLEILRNMRWWMNQHLRYVHRKLSLLPVRFEDVGQQLRWIAEEYAVLQRALKHCDVRIERLGVIGEAMRAPREWIEEHRGYIVAQLMQLDAQQESLLKDESARLTRDHVEIVSFDALLEELLQCLQYHHQLLAERIALDVQLVDLAYGSEDAIRINEQLIALKSKQKQLTTSTIDNLKVALQQRHDEHDTSNLLAYAFLDDRPDLPVHDMSQIKAVLLDTFVPSTHFAVSAYLQIYFLQPWLALQSVEDIRFEERIALKEIARGQAQEELEDVDARGVEAEKQLENLAFEVKTVEIALEARRDGDPDESDIQRERREAEISHLQSQRVALDAQIDLVHKTQTELQLVRPLKEATIERIDREIDEIDAALEERRQVREQSMNLFFDTELDLCASMIESLAKELDAVSDQLDVVNSQVESCEAPLEAYADPSESELNVPSDISLPRCLCLYPLQLPLQSLLHRSRPRVQPACKPLAHTHLFVKRQTLLLHRAYLTAYQQHLQEEAAFLSNYAAQRSVYQRFLAHYIDELQFVRRQRALENELRTRLQRLLDLREVRLKQLIEAKAEQDRLRMEEERARAEAERLRKTRFARAAATAKKNLRALKDAAREFRRNNAMKMDEEEQRMARNLREKNKEGVGSRPEAIKEIRVTIGVQQMLFFQKENDHLHDKGLPHFVKMERALVSGSEPIYLWTQMTFDDTMFITDICLSHKDVESEYHLELTRERYTAMEIPSTNLVLWWKRSQHRSKGVKELRLTFTEQEEVRCSVDGFERLSPDLSVFSLAEMVLWMQKISKTKTSSALNADAVMAEIVKVRDMLQAEPKNRNLKDLLQKLNEKLRVCLDKETKAIVTNPLQAAIELMALTEGEVAQFMKIFARIDKDERGKVTTMDIFEFLKQPATPLARELFTTLDALDDNGYVEFGDFVRVLGTFCFFGQEEILRFIYVFADKARVGDISASDFERLIEMINPVEKLRARRALKMMKIDPKRRFTLQDFVVLNGQYPALFNQVFLLQHAMRTQTLGDTWWFNKLSKYHAVRAKMAMEGDRVQEMVDVELERFHEDQARVERMAQREVRINNEADGVRKTLLQARQFLDEIS